MNNYPMIKKWLGLEVFWISTCSVPVVDAEKLEAKLAEGFEVYLNDYGSMTAKEHAGLDHKRIALGIGLQTIEKQTQVDEALEFIKFLSKLNEQSMPIPNAVLSKEAKKILEMEK